MASAELTIVEESNASHSSINNIHIFLFRFEANLRADANFLFNAMAASASVDPEERSSEPRIDSRCVIFVGVVGDDFDDDLHSEDEDEEDSMLLIRTTVCTAYVFPRETNDRRDDIADNTIFLVQCECVCFNKKEKTNAVYGKYTRAIRQTLIRSFVLLPTPGGPLKRNDLGTSTPLLIILCCLVETM